MNELLFYNLFVKHLNGYFKAIENGSIVIDNSLIEPDINSHRYSAEYILNRIYAELQTLTINLNLKGE